MEVNELNIGSSYIGRSKSGDELFVFRLEEILKIESLTISNKEVKLYYQFRCREYVDICDDGDQKYIAYYDSEVRHLSNDYEFKAIPKRRHQNIIKRVNRIIKENKQKLLL